MGVVSWEGRVIGEWEDRSIRLLSYQNYKPKKSCGFCSAGFFYNKKRKRGLVAAQIISIQHCNLLDL